MSAADGSVARPGPTGTGAWWHCFSGIAGDMALASLLDAGADLQYVLTGLRALPVEGWDLRVTKVARSGVMATKADVVMAGPDDAHRNWGTIREVISAAEALTDQVRARALSVFRRLAVAEGRVHGIAPEDVVFHEVGAVDAVVDVVGTCLALESLGISYVSSSAVPVGTGTVRTAHGVLPNPAPAVLELLAGRAVEGRPSGAELTTPTGAALLAGLSEAFGPLPPMRVRSSGYGAGTRDLPGVPNVLQVVVGELAPAAELSDLVVLESNLDDVTGEILAHAVSALLEAGARDAWLVPVVGKKGRPAHVLTALAEPHLAARLGDVIATETGALGLRLHPVRRLAFPRRTVEVSVDGHAVRVKAGPHSLKAEHDDCARAGAALGAPPRVVARRAEELARRVVE